MYHTGKTTGNPFIDPPSYVINKESEAQQINGLSNFIQPPVEAGPKSRSHPRDFS